MLKTKCKKKNNFTLSLNTHSVFNNLWPLDFLWSTHPAFCGIHKLETLCSIKGETLYPLTSLSQLPQFEQNRILPRCTHLCLPFSFTLYRNHLLWQKPRHKGEIWILKLPFGHWLIDLSPEVSLQPLIHLQCMCPCPFLLFPYTFSSSLSLYNWPKGFPLCFLLKDLDSDFCLPQFTLLGNPVCTTVILKKTALCEDTGCTTLPILLNPSFLGFRSGTTAHHSTWPMPNSCAFDQCGGTVTLVSLSALRRVWRSLDVLMSSVNFLKRAAFQKEAYFRSIVLEKWSQSWVISGR